MAQIDMTNSPTLIEATRTRARLAGHVQNAQIMLLAATIASLIIIAVAAAMMTNLF